MFEVWWDLCWLFYCKFTAESASERILKIGQYLTKLRKSVAYFFGPPGICRETDGTVTVCCWQEERSVIMLSCLCGMLTSLLFVIVVYCLRDCSIRRVCRCIYSTCAQCCCCCCRCQVSAKLHYTDTGYEHRLQTPPTDTTNGRAHNNSTTCCTTNSPPSDRSLPHPNILTCRDVGLCYCDVANLL